MIDTNSAGAVFTSSYSVSGADQNNEEIHTKDTSGRIVLQAQIDVLIDTETKAPGVGEIFPLELVLLHLQAAVKDLLSLLATNLFDIIVRAVP